MKENNQVRWFDNPLRGILIQYEQEDVLCYIGPWDERGAYEKSEIIPYTIEKMVTENTNALKKLGACVLLFEHAPYISKETAKLLFERLSYTDPCGKYDITAIKRLCVSILEEVASGENGTEYKDLAIICLCRIYDVEYADGIFDGYLTDEELKARRQKYKVCFAIVDEAFDLEKLQRLTDVTIMGVFKKSKPAGFHLLKLLKKKAVDETITVYAKEDWNSLYAGTPNTLEIQKEDIKKQLLTPSEKEQNVTATCDMRSKYLSVQRIDEMEVKEIADTYFRIVVPDFGIEVNC